MDNTLNQRTCKFNQLQVHKSLKNLKSIIKLLDTRCVATGVLLTIFWPGASRTSRPISKCLLSILRAVETGVPLGLLTYYSTFVFNLI